MKKYFILASLFAMFIFGCNTSELERLKAENDSLRSTSTAGDIKVDNYLKSLNEIQENLNQIKEKEKIISTKTTNNTEIDQNAKDQINEDILAIYELMLKNKQTIEKLNKKLASSGSKNAELQKTIKLMSQQIQEKDAEITKMKDQLAKLNFDIANLNKQITQMAANMDTMKQEVEEQTEVINNQDQALNTAYYVYGSKKELKDHGIVSKDGLFKGIKIGDNFDKSYFTKIDIRETTTIKLVAKDIQILSNHPKGSYSLVEKDGKIESLQIKDPKSFWEVSKFLVIVVD